MKVRDFHIKHSSTQLGLSTGFVDGTTKTSDITFKNFSDVENKKVFCTAKQPKPIDSQEIFNIARKKLCLPDVGFIYEVKIQAKTVVEFIVQLLDAREIKKLGLHLKKIYDSSYMVGSINYQNLVKKKGNL